MYSNYRPKGAICDLFSNFRLWATVYDRQTLPLTQPKNEFDKIM